MIYSTLVLLAAAGAQAFSAPTAFASVVRTSPVRMMDVPDTTTIESELSVLQLQIEASKVKTQMAELRLEELKAELLDHPEFRAWIESLWLGAKQSLIDAANDPASELRIRATASLQQLGQRLSTDPELQHKVDDWVQRALGYLVEHYRSEVSDLIASTVERWDGESTARRMELQVGRDLQFIRINGTLVGGLAGVVIHAAAELL